MAKRVTHKGHRHRYAKLTDDQEFALMKLVLDKFLWLGIGLIGYGLYVMLTVTTLWSGLPFILSGLGVMIVFGIVIVRYFEKKTA